MILPVKTQCRRHRRVMEVILLKQKQIKCPYCHAHASLRPASLVYGSTPQTRGKFLYVCDRWPACNAYVSAHERTLLPMGTLANGDLRHKRILAHRALKKLQQDCHMEKWEVYIWLQAKLGLDAHQTHIGHWVIVNNIHVNPGICGLEYGDLFQEGCLWLCKAAFTYNAGQAQFSTYAKKVVKNGLLSYCRKICSQGRHISRLIIGEQGELAADGEQVDQPDDHFDSHLSRLETLDLLEASKQNYQGVARLGIEALALKVQGMRITDIAALYQVPPSHVGAWISRSLEKLRNDPDFLTCLL